VIFGYRRVSRHGRKNQRTLCNFSIWTVADVGLQESRVVAEKPRDAVVKFDTYRNVQLAALRDSLRQRASCMCCLCVINGYLLLLLQLDLPTCMSVVWLEVIFTNC